MRGRTRTDLLLVLGLLCAAVAVSVAVEDTHTSAVARARIRRAAPATNTTTASGNATASNSTKPNPNRSNNSTQNRTRSSNSTQKIGPPSQSAPANASTARDAYPFPNSSWFNEISRVQVARVLEASAVVTDALFSVNHTVTGLLKVNGTLEALNIISVSAKSKVLETQSIRSPTGTVVVDGDLMIVNSQGATEAAARRAGKVGSFGLQAVSFLAEEVVLSGVKQWRLVRHDSFEKETADRDPAEGWSFAELSSCSRNLARDESQVDHFLGGHCNMAVGELKKRFDSLPPHKQVRLSARYHMIDDWQGETAFLKIGEQFVWSDRSRATEGARDGLDMCGSEDYPERRMSVPIDVILPHSDSFLEVAFGSTSLARNKGKEDPCRRSFGVDDVMVYVR